MFTIMTSAIEGPEDHDIISEFFEQNKMLLYREAWKYLSLQEDVAAPGYFGLALD